MKFDEAYLDQLLDEAVLNEAGQLNTSQIAAFLVNRLEPINPKAAPSNTDVQALNRIVRSYQTYDLQETVGQFGGTKGTSINMDRLRTLVTDKFVKGITNAETGEIRPNWHPLDAAQWIVNNQNVSGIKACFDIAEANKLCNQLKASGAKSIRGSSLDAKNNPRITTAAALGMGNGRTKTTGDLHFRG